MRYRNNLERAFYKVDRERLLSEQNNKCYYCKKPLTRSTATLDHVIPISKVKQHSIRNCVVACFTCNNNKDNKKVYKPSDIEIMLYEGIERLEERTKQAEFALSFSTKGGYNKWKKYWNKRGRWL